MDLPELLVANASEWHSWLSHNHSDHVGGLIAGTLCGLVLFRIPRQRVAVQADGPHYAQRIGPDPGVVTIEHTPEDPAPEHTPHP